MSTDELTRLDLLKRGGGLASAALLIGPGTAAARTPFGNSATRRTALTVAQPSEPSNLDPTSRDLSEGRTVFCNIFDPLIHRTTDGEFVPVVLRSWRRVSPKRWRFVIRRDIRFSDGAPLTIEDVIFSLDRYRNPRIYNASSKYSTWVNIIRRNASEFDVTTRIPDNLVIINITDLVFVVSKAYFEAHDATYLAANPMGSGPYVLDRWVRGDHLRLRAKSKYWGGPVPVRTLTYRPIPDESTRADAVIRGEVDIATQLAPQQLSRLRGQRGVRLTSTQLSTPVWIGIRLDDQPGAEKLKDVRVRQAMNYAVDKNAIIRRLLLGEGSPMGQPIPRNAFGHNPDVKSYPYNPDRARTLLRAAGASGLKLGLDLPATGLLGINPPGLAVAQYLNQVGFDVTPRVFELNAFVQKIVTDNLSNLFIQIYRDASLDAGPIYAAQILSTASTNHSHYKNRTADVLIKNGILAKTREGRLSSYHKLARLTHDEAPWIYLYSAKQSTAMRDYVKFTPRADLLVPGREVTLA